jgi:hypothetical protein
MTHYFEKTIVDVKDIYTNYLITTLTPLLYEGFYSIYEKAKSLERTYIQAEAIDPTIKNPGVLTLFQHFLVNVDKLNDNLINDETKRIRDNSKCADIFDNLIKAVIKSHIIVLTYTTSKKTCKIVNEKLHEKIETKAFIHKCYVECARLFYDHSGLFWDGFKNGDGEMDTNQIKDNQRIIYQLTKIGVKNAIKRCLPMKEILEVYLNNDYENEPESDNEYVKVKDLLERDTNKKNNDSGGIMKIIDSSESSMSENMNKLETNVDDLSALIFNRNIYDTMDGKLISSDKCDNAPTHYEQPGKQKQVEKSEQQAKQVEKSEQQSKQVEKSEQQAKQVEKSEQQSKQVEKSEQQKQATQIDQPKIYKFDETVLFNQKRTNNNILIDAIDAVKKNDEQEIDIIRHHHNHSSRNNDNYFDDM